MKKVLFVCSANAARSQMAEAILRHRADSRFKIYSAGSNPAKVHSLTIETLTRHGVSSAGLTAKNVDQFKEQTFDYVITLCEQANDDCRGEINGKYHYAWDIPDPVSRACDEPFNQAYQEIYNRISMFLRIENQDNAHAYPADGFVDPTAVFKCFTDDIRLRTLMLTHYHGEICVCELMEALEEESQPKVSRNLAVLKKAGLLVTRKHGQWVFYRLNAALPVWVKSTIAQITGSNLTMIEQDLSRLKKMQNRPDKVSFCR